MLTWTCCDAQTLRTTTSCPTAAGSQQSQEGRSRSLLLWDTTTTKHSQLHYDLYERPGILQPQNTVSYTMTGTRGLAYEQHKEGNHEATAAGTLHTINTVSYTERPGTWNAHRETTKAFPLGYHTQLTQPVVLGHAWHMKRTQRETMKTPPLGYHTHN